MVSPGIADILGTIIYAIVIFCLPQHKQLPSSSSHMDYRHAVCVLVGLYSYISLSCRKLEWLFWGWLRCFIQYAFYKLLSHAVVSSLAT